MASGLEPLALGLRCRVAAQGGRAEIGSRHLGCQEDTNAHNPGQAGSSSGRCRSGLQGAHRSEVLPYVLR